MEATDFGHDNDKERSPLMSSSFAPSLKHTLAFLLASTGFIACGSEGGDDDSAGTGGVGTVAPPMTAGSSSSAGTSAASAGSASTSAGGNSAAAGSSSPGSGTSGTSAAGNTGAGNGAAGSSAAAGSNASAAGSSGSSGSPATTEKFSFFVASYAALTRLSGSEAGFGGDLRYGQADGLSGADKICTEIAEYSLKGSGAKGWRAFLSVTKGPDGKPVNAIDRVGAGPWYDRLGRLVAENKANLMTSRPTGADPLIANDLPNEDGVPNMAPDGEDVDNHDVLTGASATGGLFNTDWAYTCHDWTSKVGSDGTPRVGHSWPRTGGPGGFPGGFAGTSGGFAGTSGGFAGTSGGGRPGGGFGGGDMANWMSALNEAGCAPGASLIEMGPPDPSNPTVGSGGGYGAIYCFALMP
jgi:hypothetical protein